MHKDNLWNVKWWTMSTWRHKRWIVDAKNNRSDYAVDCSKIISNDIGIQLKSERNNCKETLY